MNEKGEVASEGRGVSSFKKVVFFFSLSFVSLLVRGKKITIH